PLLLPPSALLPSLINPHPQYMCSVVDVHTARMGEADIEDSRRGSIDAPVLSLVSSSCLIVEAATEAPE
ncbi:hypothetical protein FQA47_003710, partial [Oryzias melastigma]